MQIKLLRVICVQGRRIEKKPLAKFKFETEGKFTESTKIKVEVKIVENS